MKCSCHFFQLYLYACAGKGRRVVIFYLTSSRLPGAPICFQRSQECAAAERTSAFNWGLGHSLALNFCCGSFDLAKTGARRQRQLAVSSAGRASLSLLQQVSSGKVDSQANCLLKLWYQQALLAASLESIWHSFLSIDFSCLLRNRLTWIKQTKVFFKESFQLFNNSLFLLISWTPAAKT